MNPVIGRVPDTLARALSTTPLLVAIGSAIWVCLDHSLHLLFAVPIIVAVQAGLMVADKRRLVASGHQECATTLRRGWSWIPAIYLWRRAVTLGEPRTGELARQWLIATAFAAMIFGLSVRMATIELDGAQRCARTVESGGLASVYGAMMALPTRAPEVCAGSLHGGAVHDRTIHYVIERRGDRSACHDEPHGRQMSTFLVGPALKAGTSPRTS